MRVFCRYGGFIWLGCLLLVSWALRLFTDPNDINFLNWNGLSGPSWSHWFGTDDLGRDILLRALDGAKVSLMIGVGAMLISVGVGTVIGGVSGYMGGRLDRITQWLLDVTMALPTLFLIIMVQAVLGPSLLNVVWVIGLTSWMPVARLVRVEMQKIRTSTMMLAVRARGLGWVAECKHAIPAALIPIRMSAVFGISNAILSESVLGFLGLGVQPPQSSWGSMLQNSIDYLGVAPWMTLVPGFLIVSTILIINQYAEGFKEGS